MGRETPNAAKDTQRMGAGRRGEGGGGGDGDGSIHPVRGE